MKSKILLSIFSTLLTIFVLEIILRLTNQSLDINGLYRRRDLAWQEKYVSLNSVGYRDTEYSKDRTQDSFRIYALGDSYTFGWLIDNPEGSYPKILEKKLNEKSPKKVEVINAGVPGFSITEELAKFKSEGIQYHPDLVLLAIMDDEALVTHTYFQRMDQFLPKFIKELRIYNATFGSLFKKISERKNHDYLISVYNDNNSKDWKEFQNKVLILQKEALKYNIQLGIVVYPHIHPNQPNVNYDLYPYNKKFNEFGKEHNIIIIDPLERFLKYKNKEKLAVNPADAHPTEEMNKLVVDEFLQKFDVQNYIQNRTIYNPKILTVNVNKDTLSIGKYRFIRNIQIENDTNTKFPWIYYETKNDELGMQEFPLKDLTFRQTPFNVDRMQVVKNSSGIIGADIVYYVKPQKEGQIILPENLYGYPIIGINNILGTYVVNGDNVGDLINPEEIISNNGNFIINFKTQKNFRLFKINIKVGVKKVDINQDGKIESMEQTIQLDKIVDKDSKKIIIPTETKTLGTPEFSDGVKRFAYAFVDGKFTKIENVSVNKNDITLTFSQTLKKNQQIRIFTASAYNLSADESLIFEVEQEPD